MCDPHAVNASFSWFKSDCLFGECNEQGVCVCLPGYQHDQAILRFHRCSMNVKLFKVIYGVSVLLQLGCFLKGCPLVWRLWNHPELCPSVLLKRAAFSGAIAALCLLGGTTSILVRGSISLVSFALICMGNTLLFLMYSSIVFNLFHPLERSLSLLDETRSSTNERMLKFIARHKLRLNIWLIAAFALVANGLPIAAWQLPDDKFNNCMKLLLQLIISYVVGFLILTMNLISAMLRYLEGMRQSSGDGFASFRAKLRQWKTWITIVCASAVPGFTGAIVFLEVSAYVPFSGYFFATQLPATGIVFVLVQRLIEPNSAKPRRRTARVYTVNSSAVSALKGTASVASEGI